MDKNEVCIFVEKEICPVIDYRWSKITMGTEYKFSKVLKSTNQYSMQRMRNFIQFERIQQVHEKNTKGSCICINGTYERHKEIYYNLVREYLSKFQNNVLKVAVFIQGTDAAPYQLVESSFKIEKTRLDLGRISSSKFITDAYINQVNQIEPYLEEIDQEIIADRQLNVNITLSIFNRFTIIRTYNLIFVQDNLNCLIKYWKEQINSRQIVIFKNTQEQSKTIVSFLNDQNRKDLPNYLQQLSQMQDERQDSLSSYIKSDNKPIINNKLKYRDEIPPKVNPNTQDFNKAIREQDSKPYQRQDQGINKDKPVLKTNYQEILVINTMLQNTIKQNDIQTNKMSKQLKKEKVASQIQHQSQKGQSQNRFSTPNQRFSQKQQGISNNEQISNKKNNSQQKDPQRVAKDPQRVAKDIIIRIYDLLKMESEKEIIMIQVYTDPIKVEVLPDQASKKFEIKRTNVKPKFKIQLVDGVFDMRDTKIILKKGNCDSDEQQKKFRTFIELCMNSNLKYFHLIQGKLPKEFFFESQKKKKMSKVVPQMQDRFLCSIS